MRTLSIKDRLKMKIATQIPAQGQNFIRGRGVLSICFDDIPRTAWTNGGRILADHGVKATYYLNGGLCGQDFEGRAQYTREDAEAIYEAGHEIGSHLYNHVSVLHLSDDELERQIDMNDLFFDEVFGRDFQAESFAYPYGDISISAKRICAKRFKSCRSVMQAINNRNIDRAQLKIIPLDQGFADYINWNAIFTEAARKKSWVISLAHGVEKYPSFYSCHSYILDQVLHMARHAGLDILPVATVINQNQSLSIKEAA